MSGYLSRMATRTQAGGRESSLQPIVRSASPIAERDQRIGMAGFDGFEFGGPSLADVGSEATEVKQGGDLRPSLSSPITTVSGTNAATVQRKMANPSTASIGPAVGTAAKMANAVNARTMDKNQVVRPILGQSDAQLPSEWAKVTDPNRQFASTGSYAGAAINVETFHHSVAAQKNAAMDLEEALSPSKHIPREISNADHTQPSEVLRHANRVAVQVRSPWQAKQADAPPELEPSPPAFAEPMAITSVDTGPTIADERSPVVIGRVNVEVVPPSVSQPGTAPRPGPLTAASVSVIGPLSGGMLASRRLSLRYR